VPLILEIMFIELSTKQNGKFIGNLNQLQRVFTNKEGVVCVVGWNNNGYIEIEETYEEVIEKINKINIKVNRL
jgi:hypothetical protein